MPYIVDPFLSAPCPLREPQGALVIATSYSSKLTWSPDNSATMNSIQGQFYYNRPFLWP
jgi:hypothetical protein